MGRFTTSSLIQGITQIALTTSTYPTTTQEANWIEEAEADIEERALGNHTTIGQLIDVPSQTPTAGEMGFKYNVKSDVLSFIMETGGALIPLNDLRGPLISVTKLEKNDEALDDTPEWETLLEGPGDATDFIVLSTGDKALGYALFIYDDTPLAGPKRLRMSYTYGRNVNQKILQEYCTLQVAIKVLEARRGTSSADGLTEFTGGSLGTYVPTQYADRINSLRARIAEIEAKHFQRRAMEKRWAMIT